MWKREWPEPANVKIIKPKLITQADVPNMSDSDLEKLGRDLRVVEEMHNSYKQKKCIAKAARKAWNEVAT